MTPIYIPPQPVPIIRQRIRNQADIQDQLRAYDTQQQSLINANDVRFDENNIGRKTTMFPEPSLMQEEAKEPEKPKRKLRIVGDIQDTRAAEEPTIRQPDPVTTKRLIDDEGKLKPKTNDELKREIFESLAMSGQPVPLRMSRKNKDDLQSIARGLGIDIYKR